MDRAPPGTRPARRLFEGYDKMRSIMPLQTTIDATGGSPLVIILVLLGMLFTAFLSLVVAYLVLRGYRRNRNRARLYLAVGLVLLTTGPIVIQLVLTNLTTLSAVSRSAAANTSKLLGLGAMLYAIYGGTRPRPPPKMTPDADRSDEVRK